MKREDKIKEDSQLFQIRTNKKLAKKDKAKKGKGKENDNKFFCKHQAKKRNCYNCGDVGHRAQDCPSPNKKSFKYSVFLSDLDIITINCTVNGFRTKAVIDSGCKHVLISY
jgi:hypothetical protein